MTEQNKIFSQSSSHPSHGLKERNTQFKEGKFSHVSYLCNINSLGFIFAIVYGNQLTQAA